MNPAILAVNYSYSRKNKTKTMPDIPQTELEYLTRRKRIDPELATQGWTITLFNEQTPPTTWLMI